VIPDDDAKRIGELPQVAEVMPVKLKMTPCMAMTDTIAIHGVDKERVLDFRSYNVDPAALALFRQDTAGALVGEKIAARYGWKPGTHITLDQLDGLRLNIHGLFSANGSSEDYIILTGRKYLQEAEDMQGISNHVLVKLKPGADPDDTARAITELPLTTQTTAQPERAMLAATLDQLSDLVSASRIVIVVVLAVILIAMGNAISMATRDRTREFGILRTLGYSKAAIVGLVLGEALLQALVGGLVGCAIVQFLVSGNYLNAVSTCGMCINLTVGVLPWVAGVGAIVLAGALGALTPALNAARLDVVDAIRRED
jgi:putative ABC transport system permease protein